MRAAFEANFTADLELGAAVAMTVDGESVVDLWAGDADDAGRPWDEHTIVNVYSSTKTMAALCVLMLADRGRLEFDAPVADYWPEFAENGKGGVLVRHVMSHTAAVPGFEPALRTEDLYDWDTVCTNLAAQAPWWEPGSAFGYHAVSQGYLQGELVRRVDGRTLGTFFREEVAEPLGADFHIGLPASEDARVADLVPPPHKLMDDLEGAEPGSLAARMKEGTPALDGTEPRTRAWRAAEIPAGNGIGNARGIARVHAALAGNGTLDGVRLLGEDTLARIVEEQIRGFDVFTQMPGRFGMGFGLATELIPFPNPRTFFWGGWGGSIVVIDRDERMSFAYVMNRMSQDLAGDVRGAGIIIAAYTALASG